MSLENINLNPRFTQHLVYNLSAFSHAPLVVADVGG